MIAYRVESRDTGGFILRPVFYCLEPRARAKLDSASDLTKHTTIQKAHRIQLRSSVAY